MWRMKWSLLIKFGFKAAERRGETRCVDDALDKRGKKRWRRRKMKRTRGRLGSTVVEYNSKWKSCRGVSIFRLVSRFRWKNRRVSAAKTFKYFLMYFRSDTPQSGGDSLPFSGAREYKMPLLPTWRIESYKFPCETRVSPLFFLFFSFLFTFIKREERERGKLGKKDKREREKRE